MDLNELLSAFAARTGLATVPENEDGTYWLKIDSFPIGFSEDEAGRRILLETPIARRDEASAGDLAEILLELNRRSRGSFGGTLSFDRASGCYVYERRETLCELDGQSFTDLVDDFVNRAETLQGLIGEFVRVYASAERAIERQTAEEVPLQDLSEGFLRV